MINAIWNLGSKNPSFCPLKIFEDQKTQPVSEENKIASMSKDKIIDITY